MTKLTGLREKYNKPTPNKWQKIGDSFLIIGSTVTSITAFTLPPIVTAIAAGFTAIGRVIINLSE